MPRPAVLVTIAALGVIAALGYSYATRMSPVDLGDTAQSIEEHKPAASKQLSNSDTSSAPPQANIDNAPSGNPADPVQRATPDVVARWIADTQSTDARTRAAAIAALAEAPKLQAMPALKRVLEVGEPQVDRQIALHSLHVLALNDGDGDGAIRDVLRHALYHGDDEGVMQSAQAVLDDIEAELAQRAESR